MEKEIYKIVITGGPCAGKSTALARIEEEMSKLGYKVIYVNEVATELILNGLNYASVGSGYDFQINILKMQMLKENYYEEACKRLNYNKILLIHDRGFADSKAFVTEDEFNKILKQLKLDFITERDKYDAVFHLVTAAKGAEEFYSLESNVARSETKEQAIMQDTKLISCWTGHPHFRVIDNSTDFETKINRLIVEIKTFLGEPIPYETERKFLIKMPDLSKLKQMPNSSEVNIIQTYLESDNPNEEVRVRQRGKDGSFIYTLTKKIKVTDVKRIETEKRITEKEYVNYLTLANTKLKQVKKTRYCVLSNNIYYEIDVYPTSKQNAICEIELSDENQKISFQDFISVIREVTNEPQFKNSSIAKKTPKELMK